MNYFQRIDDKHTNDALKQIVDALNQLRQTDTGTTAQVAALAASRPTIQQIQQQLQAGGQAPLNVNGLPGTLSNPQTASGIGTHAQRVATIPKAGVFWVETDRLTLYVGETSGTSVIWVYVAGTMYDTFANRPTDLGANDVGFLYVPSEHLHWCHWTGSAWVILDNDAGTFIDSAVALGAGYQLCDGSATTYLAISGATLVETAFTTPDETSTGAARTTYHRSNNTYSGAVIPATLPNFVGDTDTTSPNSGSTTVMAGVGATVAADGHTHTVLVTGNINLPDNPVQYLNVIRYFRR